MSFLKIALPLRSSCCQRSFSTTQIIFAGHSKWANIKAKKGVNDAQRGQLFSRVARDIAIAIRSGGSADPALNTLLANTIKKAKEQDVPKDNIERAIERANGKNKKGEVVTYEAMFESVGIIIESLTDNLNRTFGNLREIFNDHGIQKASIKWMFKKVGRVDITFPKPNDPTETQEQDAILGIAFANDVEDFDIVDSEDDEGLQLMKLYCPPEHLAQLAKAVSAYPVAELQERKIMYVPDSESASDAPLSADSEAKLAKALERLWADEDTLNIWTTNDKL